MGECPGCGHLSTFLCLLISHLACFHFSQPAYPPHQCPFPEKPAFYIYYRTDLAATNLGRKKNGTRSHIQSCIVSKNSESVLGTPSHCRETPSSCCEGNTAASHARPTDRSTKVREGRALQSRKGALCAVFLGTRMFTYWRLMVIERK